MIINGQNQCCPLNKGYVTCGGSTCVCKSYQGHVYGCCRGAAAAYTVLLSILGGICCNQQGRACEGLSECCSDGGCCDTGTTCCGDQCCYRERDCCGNICCDEGYYCASRGNCMSKITSAATTIAVATVTVSPNQGLRGVGSVDWKLCVVALLALVW
jgi:hypothetical protein